MEAFSIAGSYQAPDSVFDELIDESGRVRAHWIEAMRGLSLLDAAGLEGRRLQAHALLHEHGVTFNAFGNSPSPSRPWKLDILPFVLNVAEWRELSRGIAQRARLLDLIARDLYGARELLRTGLIPPAVVYSHPCYQQAFRHLISENGQTPMLHLYGIELARSVDGRWWTMADRSDRTYGIGYALENRVVQSRSMPNLIRSCRVERLAPFFMRLQETLSGLATRATEYPHIVLLSDGPASPVYFEDQYLARYLGYTLVECGDLAVRNDCVALKTLDGLLPVDVILGRIPEHTIDPLELGDSSPNGVPGLLQAVRRRNVALVNTPGTGLFESPVFMPFLRDLCRELLGEDLRIPSIATWWCRDDDAREFVLANLQDLVVKPAFRYSGSDEIVVSDLDSTERNRLRDDILARPSDYVAQEKMQRSAAPAWTGHEIHACHVGLRTFAVSCDDSFQVMPGALVRSASDSGPMELSISGGEGSKDAWVISDQPVRSVSLLPSPDTPIAIRRSTSQLPSRAADNLFWLGRHIDRAETSARLLRAIAERLAGEGGSANTPEIPALLRVLTAENRIPERFVTDDFTQLRPEADELLTAAVFDENESNSLRGTITKLAWLASTVRDLISNDTWRTILRIDESFHLRVEATETPLADSLDRLDSVIVELAACSGLISDGMVRGPAWRFLDMGRRMERCFCTIGLLRHSVIRERQLPQTRPILDALLDVADCRSMYRARYLSGARLVAVVDLIVTDETNPRSIGHQLTVLSNHIDALPRDGHTPTLTVPQKLIRSAVHEMRMADLDKLCLSTDTGFDNMDRFLNSISAIVSALSDHLTRRYLVHSGAPRQITDEELSIG